MEGGGSGGHNAHQGNIQNYFVTTRTRGAWDIYTPNESINKLICMRTRVQTRPTGFAYLYIFFLLITWSYVRAVN